MRKIILSMFVTLDGFIARTNGDTDWSASTKETEQDIYHLLEHAGAILLGGEAYQVLANY